MCCIKYLFLVLTTISFIFLNAVGQNCNDFGTLCKYDSDCCKNLCSNRNSWDSSWIPLRACRKSYLIGDQNATTLVTKAVVENSAVLILEYLEELTSQGFNIRSSRKLLILTIEQFYIVMERLNFVKQNFFMDADFIGKQIDRAVFGYFFVLNHVMQSNVKVELCKGKGNDELEAQEVLAYKNAYECVDNILQEADKFQKHITDFGLVLKRKCFLLIDGISIKCTTNNTHCIEMHLEEVDTNLLEYIKSMKTILNFIQESVEASKLCFNSAIQRFQSSAEAMVLNLQECQEHHLKKTE